MDPKVFHADLWTLCDSAADMGVLRQQLVGKPHPYFTDLVCQYLCTEEWPAYKGQLVVRLNYVAVPHDPIAPPPSKLALPPQPLRVEEHEEAHHIHDELATQHTMEHKGQ